MAARGERSERSEPTAFPLHGLPCYARPVIEAPLISVGESGMRCDRGGFHVDPSRPVDCAVVTHAHIDHARRGSRLYVAARSCVPVLRARLGRRIRVQALDYGERVRLGDVWVSLHPAGHVLGSAQVRVERGAEVWVFTGDFKRDADPSCEPFEIVRCDTLITEATFGMPEYRWEPAGRVVEAIRLWWHSAPERPSVLFCYAFGKTQRVLAELARLTERTVYLHADAVRITEIYRRAGVRMVPTAPISAVPKGQPRRGDLVIAPPSASGTRWMRRFHDAQTGFVSGWMHAGGGQGRYDRGFALSDHADWPQLVETVRESGARCVYVTHGEGREFTRHLRESLGVEAHPLSRLSEDRFDDCPGRE